MSLLNVDPRLFEYYETLFAEGERLMRREGQLELARTRELLLQYLPQPPATVIDIGGGTGVYSAWLASLGYRVHLVDVVPSHVAAASGAGGFTAAVADARALPLPDASFEAALLMGPLYHLLDPGDRALAIGEARRCVPPGGLVVGAFISRGAVALDGYVKGWIDNPSALDIMASTVRDGSFDSDRSGFGVISYFHLPSEARHELEAQGLEVLALMGLEGPGWIAADFDERWERSPEVVLDSARACEDIPELLALSAHLLAVCRRPA